PVIPVLVFDQFEEIFTLGRNQVAVEEFLTELADLVENYIPAKIRSSNAVVAMPFPHDASHCKIILSLREDFVWRLDSLSNAMPSVMHNRFTMTSMNRDQALLAVREPGRGLLDDRVAERIVNIVAAGKPHVDPALLSTMCRELNARRIKN